MVLWIVGDSVTLGIAITSGSPRPKSQGRASRRPRIFGNTSSAIPPAPKLRCFRWRKRAYLSCLFCRDGFQFSNSFWISLFRLSRQLTNPARHEIWNTNEWTFAGCRWLSNWWIRWQLRASSDAWNCSFRIPPFFEWMWIAFWSGLRLRRFSDRSAKLYCSNPKAQCCSFP